MTNSATTVRGTERLHALGTELPPVAVPSAAYLPAVRTGDLVYTSGQLPLVDGTCTCTERSGNGVGRGRVCGGPPVRSQLWPRSTIWSASKRRAGRQGGRLRGVREGFTQQPVVINGASDFLVEVFGEAGRHARSAIGLAELPRGSASRWNSYSRSGDTRDEDHRARRLAWPNVRSILSAQADLGSYRDGRFRDRVRRHRVRLLRHRRRRPGRHTESRTAAACSPPPTPRPRSWAATRSPVSSRAPSSTRWARPSSRRSPSASSCSTARTRRRPLARHHAGRDREPRGPRRAAVVSLATSWRASPTWAPPTTSTSRPSSRCNRI